MGLYLQTGSEDVLEMAAAAGFDYGILDAQHGSLGMESIVSLLRAADASGITPLVRVPSHDPTFIMRVLDAGAMGVVVPNIDTAEQARTVVGAARYKLDDNGGTRGACPSTRAAWHQAEDWKSFVVEANADVVVWLIVESQLGLDNLPEIAGVPGIDGLIPGTFDLSHEMGLLGERTHATVNDKFLSMARLAKEMGVPLVRSLRASEPTAMAAEIRTWTELGACAFGLGGDRRIVSQAFKARVAAARHALGLPA
jgi:4-hydroxy-2-oxoheptanedioate aldolase